jgi:hypothetical protein
LRPLSHDRLCGTQSRRASSIVPSSIAAMASGIATPARIYDLRSTFASNALAAGITVFELAKLMGTSVTMIERSYGTLIGGAHAGITGRLDAIEAQLERTNDETEEAQS